MCSTHEELGGEHGAQGGKRGQRIAHLGFVVTDLPVDVPQVAKEISSAPVYLSPLQFEQQHHKTAKISLAA